MTTTIVKIGIIVDPVGSINEPEHEIEGNFKEISILIGETAKLVYSKTYPDNDIPNNLDVLIVDYGGMSMGAGDTAVFNLREFVKYAQEHPSCLLIIWTKYTRALYEDEIAKDFSDMNNVYLRTSGLAEYPSMTYREEWDKLKIKVRTWCGIPLDQKEYYPEVHGNLIPPGELHD